MHYFTRMKIAVLKETRLLESRVAATPDTVKRLIAAGAEVYVQSGAGERSSITDAAYIDAGADTVMETGQCVGDADIVLCVNAPEASTLSAMKKARRWWACSPPTIRTPNSPTI